MSEAKLTFKWVILVNGKVACECTEASRPLYEQRYRELFPKAKIEAKSALTERIRRLKEKKEKEAEGEA